MSEEPTTPRRSSRIIQTKLSIKPVRSFKRGYAWTWPQDCLDNADVDVPAVDAEEAQAFFSAIIRREPAATEPASSTTASRSFNSNGKKKPARTTEKDNGEVFRIGDTVLVATQNSSFPSVGVIVALWQPHTNSDSELSDVDSESDGDGDTRKKRFNDKWWVRADNKPQPRIRVHWFIQPSELPKVRAPRDHAANEVYYSLKSTAIISPTNILARCVVSNDPTDASDLGDSDGGEQKFCCFYAINAEKGVFYMFNWQLHREKAIHNQNGKIVRPNAWTVVPRDEDIDNATPTQGNNHFPHARKKRRLNDDNGPVEEDSAVESSVDDSAEEFEPNASDSGSDEIVSDASASPTPKSTSPRKRRRGATSSRIKARDVVRGPQMFQTPTKQKASRRPVVLSPIKSSASVAPTPHSKAVLRNRQKLKTRRAATVQRLAAPEFSVTDAKTLARLPKDAQLRAMHALHVGSRPDSLSCRDEEFTDVLEKVLVLLEDGVGGCVYISGVPGTGKTATVHAVVRELHGMAKRNEINPFTYVEINGLKIPEPAAAYGVLWESLSRHDVAVEGHLRMSSKETLKRLDRHFSGGGTARPGSHACIVLMDELDQLVTVKQDVVYNFFNWPTLANSRLIVLAVANTMDLPERAMTGKVRSRLGMERVDFRPYKREQLEAIVHARLKAAAEGLDNDTTVMEPDAIKLAAARVAAVSGDARRVLDVCRRAVEVCHAKKVGPVKTKNISEVMAEMQNSPTASYIRNCSFHERVMLAAVWKYMKRTGVSVVKWEDIAYQHVNLVAALAQDLDSQRRLSLAELLYVLDSLTAARALLIEDARKGLPDGERKVMLNLEEAEVLRVLGETGGPKWRSFLGI